MTRNVRTYGHFCMVARALERVGDRWSLLVIRDLLTGDKRFTDLMDRLGGITPKTLTLRLRELEEAGIVAADREPGRCTPSTCCGAPSALSSTPPPMPTRGRPAGTSGSTAPTTWPRATAAGGR